jgi:hypothetical protein
MPSYGTGRPPYRRPYSPQTSSSGLIEPRKPENTQSAAKLHESNSAASGPKREVQIDRIVPPAPPVTVEFPVAATLQMNSQSQLATTANVPSVSETIHGWK